MSASSISNKNVDIPDLVEFILTNRRKGTFTRQTAATLPQLILELIIRKEIFWVTDDMGKLTGVITFKLIPEMEAIFVVNVLTTNPETLKLFVTTIAMMWPNYQMLALRRERIKVYHNTPRFLNKIISQRRF